MLSKIFKGDYLSRLDNIQQWSEKNRLHSENVCSHSFKVAVFTRVLLEDIFNTDEVSDFRLACTTYALFHDFDEALLLRDISHETKYNDFNGDEIREALNNYVAHVTKKEFDEHEWDDDRDGTEIAYHQTPASKMMIMNIIDPDPDVKMFVKLADWLGLLYNLRVETHLGNDQAWVKHCTVYCIKSVSVLAVDVKKMIQNKFKDHDCDFTVLDSLINKYFYQLC